MPIKKKEKKQYFPESFQQVICHDKKLQPFINSFHLRGTNFDQQKIGEVFGIIQILDHSENSAYIPNLLAQVIKKEFFSNPKRNTSEGFEIALHKANLALTDLAQHEVIEWIGKISAVIGVIKNTEFNFTQVGGGKILLLRNKVLTDISRGLDTGEGIGHPIKTFSNISSGKLEQNDKIIFASEYVFDSLALEDLKRHSQTFDSKEFDNIVNSTLEIESENAAIIIVNLAERDAIEIEQEEKEKLEGNMNYFGNKPAKKIEKEEDDAAATSLKEETEDSVSQEITAEEKIKESPEKEEGVEDLSRAQTLAAAEAKIKKEKEENEKVQKTQPQIIDDQAVAEYYNSDEEESSPFEDEPELFIKEKDIEKEEMEIAQKINENNLDHLDVFKKWLAIKQKVFVKFIADLSKTFTTIKNGPRPRDTKLTKIESSDSPNFIPENQFKRLTTSTENKKLPSPSFSEKFFYYIKIFLKASLINTEKIIQIIRKKTRKLFRKIKKVDFKKFPSVTSIKKIPSILLLKIKSFNFRKLIDGDWIKFLSLAGITIFVIFLLFLIVHFTKTIFRDDITENNNQNQPSLLENPVLEKEFKIENLKSIAQIEERITSVSALDKNLFFSTESNKLLQVNTQNNQLENISLPNYIKEIQTVTAMPDLRLVLIVNSESIYSYSPVTKKFYENKIELPSNFKNQSSNVYLTYIYLLDKESNQILQYPRATGGFGEKREWIKEEVDITKSFDIAIDGSIYITFEDGHVEKFFQGKKQKDFGIGQTEPAIIAGKIRGNIDSEKLFVLDSENQRVVELDKNGAIQKQFQDRQFLGAQNFWVDFEQKIIYIITSEGKILSFNYN